MSAGHYLDLAVIVLLVAGAVGGLMINRRLARLMTAQADLKSALETFDAAAARADAALKRLEAAGLVKGADLQAKTAQAGALITELSVMISAGARIADRIEGAVKDVRAIGAARPKRAA